MRPRKEIEADVKKGIHEGDTREYHYGRCCSNCTALRFECLVIALKINLIK